MTIIINNNPLIVAYRVIEKTIRENVMDVNETRRSLPSAREKQWIFPSAPEDLTNFYPRIAIVLTGISYHEYGAGQFKEYVRDIESGYVSEVKGNITELSLTIGIFTKKKDQFRVKLPGETKPGLYRGILLNTFLTGEVLKALQSTRNDMIDEGLIDVVVNRASPTYNDGVQLYASDITVTVSMYNTWGKEYTPGELIQQINEYYTINDYDDFDEGPVGPDSESEEPEEPEGDD